jgi:hypothetical protein
VREQLHTALVDAAAQGFPLHLSLDRTRDDCQWMAMGDVPPIGASAQLARP